MADADLIRATTAATLRAVAGWGDITSDELYDIARQVEAVEPGDMCCPVCEEVDCDEDCPLASVRRLS